MSFKNRIPTFLELEAALEPYGALVGFDVNQSSRSVNGERHMIDRRWTVRFVVQKVNIPPDRLVDMHEWPFDDHGMVAKSISWSSTHSDHLELWRTCTVEGLFCQTS